MDRPREKKPSRISYLGIYERSDFETISSAISWRAILFRRGGGGGGGIVGREPRTAKFYARSAGRYDLRQSVEDGMLKRVSVKTRGIRGIARWCISWCGPSFRRTIERKKEREGSGPEDKCLPTRSRPPFYQGSRSSRFNERKSGREKEMGREREREDRATPAQLAPPRCKCTCTSYAPRLVSLRAGRFQLPIGIGGIGIGIGI